MEELIKEAKWLYFQIENTQEKLVKSRLRNEEDNKHTALIELETEMCATLQLLKCILDRKDNVVDLGEVWHNIIEEPDGVNNIVINVDNDWCINISSIVYKDRWNSTVSRFAAKRWAYLEDLLPKGDKAWNTTK